MIYKIFRIIAATFLTSKEGLSNQRLNSTVITFAVSLCLLSLCVFVCIILYNDPNKFDDIIIYFGGLLTTFLSFAITGKLIQKKLEVKKEPPDTNTTTDNTIKDIPA